MHCASCSFERVLCSSGWSQMHNEAEADLELLILSRLPPKYWDYTMAIIIIVFFLDN